MSQIQRKIITQEEFNKKVTIAMAHYEYLGHMSRSEAVRKALQEVEQEFQVKNQESLSLTNERNF